MHTRSTSTRWPGTCIRSSVGAWFILAWVGDFVAGAIMVGVVRGLAGA